MTITAELVVGGAVADSQNFRNSKEFEEWLRFVKDDARNWDADATYEVYVIEHHHPNVADCECIQFVMDHRPYWSRNV